MGSGREWPGGNRLAVWTVLNVEHFLPGRPGPTPQPHLSHGLDIAGGSWREYGNQAGFWRLLDLFTELGVPVTAAVNSSICRQYPRIVEAIRSSGWEVMAHGRDNSTGHFGLDPQAEYDLVTQCVETLGEAFGQYPSGWLTPGFSVSERTHEFARARGVTYVADYARDDRPSWLSTPAGPLVAVPYSLETNDITVFLSSRHTGAQFAATVTEHADQLLRERGGGGRVMALGLHTFLVGQPARIGYLRRCLEHILAADGVWLATGRQVAEEFAKENVP